MRDAEHRIRYMRNRVRGSTVRTYADACRYKRVGTEKSAYGRESRNRVDCGLDSTMAKETETEREWNACR